MKTDMYNNPEYYRNREISWLSFDERILDEARDKTLPLFERLKFLSISASNLDEFFMVRVASVRDMMKAGIERKDIAGLTPKEQFKLLIPRTHELMQAQYQVYNRSLLPALHGIGLEVITSHEKLTKEQAEDVDRYFMEDIYPVLTPMAMDSARPFPLIANKALNIGLLIRKKEAKKEDELEFATVQVPSVLPRIYELPEQGDDVRRVILLEEIIRRNIGRLFLGNEVICASPYRVTRDADMEIDEDDAEDLLKEIQRQLKKRRWGQVIRLEVEEGINKKLLKILKDELEVREENIYMFNGPLDLTFLMKMYGLKGFEDYKVPGYTPAAVPALMNDDTIYDNIRKQDILLHHPYMTFDPVVEFIRQGASDPQVLAIKMTLYRVSGNSPIIAALAQAADNGKQVTVLVELKARFDEENNIGWAKKLEKAGCHVIYGLLGLKTHSKIALIVRREEDGIRRYVHLGTGNYNDSTAKLYTDCGILTCDREIGEDATAVFNMLSGYSEPSSWHHLIVAPIWMKKRFLRMIEREAANARAGKEGHIIAKMNSLCDPDIISALYAASAAGVKIELIVRGICCLKTGIEGVSENITVRSIVGNFLEHARIFYFYNNGVEEVYMGSADWMPRNLNRRVEIVFPVLDPEVKEQVMHIVNIQLEDTLKARILQPDGSYERVDLRGKEKLCAQDFFCKEATHNARVQDNKLKDQRIFIPAEPVEEV